MSFDYGADPEEVLNSYKLWPTDGELTALLDGDMFPYIVAYTVDQLRANRAYQMATHLYGKKEPDCNDWEWIECMLKTPYFTDKVEHLNTTLNSWVDGAKADSAKVYLTTSNDNYRNVLAFSKPYKGQRKSDKPQFFYELRAYLTKMHECIVAHGNEADDLMAIEQWKDNNVLIRQGVILGSQAHKDFASTIICSKDKDLRIVPGLHYDTGTNEMLLIDEIGFLSPVLKEKEAVKYEWHPLFDGKPITHDEAEDMQAIGVEPDTYSRGAKAGQIKTKRVRVGYEVVEYIDKLSGGGLKFFYSQLITGDTVDNYPGIVGAGATSAYEILNNCTTERELFEATLKAYKDKFKTAIFVDNYRGGTSLLTPYQMMLEQGRLAHMQSYKGELWRDKHYCPDGEDLIWKTE